MSTFISINIKTNIASETWASKGVQFRPFFTFMHPYSRLLPVSSHFSVCSGQHDALFAVFLSFMHHSPLICMKKAHFGALFLRRMHRIQNNAIIFTQMGLSDAIFSKNELFVHPRGQIFLRQDRDRGLSGKEKDCRPSIKICSRIWKGDHIWIDLPGGCFSVISPKMVRSVRNNPSRRKNCI